MGLDPDRAVEVVDHDELRAVGGPPRNSSRQHGGEARDARRPGAGQPGRPRRRRGTACPLGVLMSAAASSTPAGTSADPERLTARTARPWSCRARAMALPAPPDAPDDVLGGGHGHLLVSGRSISKREHRSQIRELLLFVNGVCRTVRRTPCWGRDDTWRERLRLATIADNQQAALDEIATAGAGELSIRGTAAPLHESVGLYWYFDSLDSLLTELIADGVPQPGRRRRRGRRRAGQRSERLEAGTPRPPMELVITPTQFLLIFAILHSRGRCPRGGADGRGEPPAGLRSSTWSSTAGDRHAATGRPRALPGYPARIHAPWQRHFPA